MKPMFPDLNAAIAEIASRLPRYEVAAEAPETYEAIRAHWATTGELKVREGGSAATIYADAGINHAFRAWHDYCHIRGGFDFTIEGKTRTCELQIADLRRIVPWARPALANVLRAEVIGQANYLKFHGRFPAKQANFVWAYLKDAGAALRNPNF